MSNLHPFSYSTLLPLAVVTTLVATTALVQAGHSVEFVAVSDSRNLGDDPIDALNSQNDGNNINWAFDGVLDEPGTDFPLDWSHRLRITIPAEMVEVNLNDFPVYLDLSTVDSHFFTETNADCGDIRMTKSDQTTQLPREVVWCDTTAETGELHFKADFLSSSTDNIFYLYYGNNYAEDHLPQTTYGAHSVWVAGHQAVWHLQESGDGSADEFQDSTSNLNHGTGGGGASADTPTAVSAVMGQGQEFDGSGDHIEIAGANLNSQSDGEDLPLSNTLRIGQYDSTVFKGVMDEPRIYDRALSAGEVQTLYNNQNPEGEFYQTGSAQEVRSFSSRIRGGVRIRGGTIFR